MDVPEIERADGAYVRAIRFTALGMLLRGGWGM
jgi:hypothetical protein